MWELLKNVNLSALAKALEETGKALYNIGLLATATWIFQPLIKGEIVNPLWGFVVALLSFTTGFTLIYISGVLKEGQTNE